MTGVPLPSNRRRPMQFRCDVQDSFTGVRQFGRMRRAAILIMTCLAVGACWRDELDRKLKRDRGPTDS